MNALNHKDAVVINKEVGETPLEALERFRSTRSDLKGVPMTYAGRLDPMAEGKLIILIGDECRNKGKYLELDKEYEVGIVLGVSTDTHDALGLAGAVDGDKKGNTSSRMSDILGFHLSDLTKYVGRFTQSYPAFSSKTVNGKQLHELARADGLPEEMPTKEVEIYSIELLEDTRINAKELKTRIFNAIDKVNGDFRQETIKKQWDGVLTDPAREFRMIKIRVKCSSGTYMRSLAHRMGRDAGTGAFAISIKRTGIGGM